MTVKNNRKPCIVLVVITLLFLLFGGGTLTNGTMHEGMGREGRVGNRSWMTPLE